MKPERKRFSLDLNIEFWRKLKLHAIEKNMTMREFCLSAIMKQMYRDEISEMPTLPSDVEGVRRYSDMMKELQSDYGVKGNPVNINPQSSNKRPRSFD